MMFFYGYVAGVVMTSLIVGVRESWLAMERARDIKRYGRPLECSLSSLRKPSIAETQRRVEDQYRDELTSRWRGEAPPLSSAKLIIRGVDGEPLE